MSDNGVKTQRKLGKGLMDENTKTKSKLNFNVSFPLV